VTGIDDLRLHVGAAVFDEARRCAWKTAAGTGTQRGADMEWPAELANVPHELCDLIWFNPELPPNERVGLHFELYREMPCYANLMYASLEDLNTAELKHLRTLRGAVER
jgi:hypothetical protein